MSDVVSPAAAASDATVDPKRPWAVRQADEAGRRRVLEDYLSRRGLREVVRFAPYHDDRLNRELCAGRYAGVVLADLDALWEGVWKGHAQIDRWLAAGVRIEIADCPLDADALRLTAEQIYASWSAWRRRSRRRQIAATFIACLLSLAAMAAMIWIVPR